MEGHTAKKEKNQLNTLSDLTTKGNHKDLKRRAEDSNS